MNFIIILTTFLALSLAHSTGNYLQNFQVKLISKGDEHRAKQPPNIANLLRNRVKSKNLQKDTPLLEEDYLPEGLKNIIENKLAEIDYGGWPESDRIYGGQMAPRNAYPHQVGLKLTSYEGRESWCGGSVISNTYVLTAAHCLRNIRSATLILGAYDRLDDKEKGRITQTIGNNYFKMHPDWASDTLNNDIALVRLQEPVQYSAKIQPIALPSASFESLEKANVTISGWGFYDGTQQLARYLRHAKTTVVSNSICRQYFGNYIHSTHICLDGSHGRGSCNGDSGGPAIIKTATGVTMLVGLTSFGSGRGCDKSLPVVFTRISSYLDWISENIDKRIDFNMIN